MVTQRSEDEIRIQKERKAEWMRTSFAPVVARIQAFAEVKARGNPPEARKFLRDHAGACEAIAKAALSTMIMGIVKRDGLTGLSSNVGYSVAKALNVKLTDGGQAIQIGMALVSIICDATGAASIIDKHGDRPEKAAGGVTITPEYELRPTKGKFLAEAVRFGAVGMPTFSKEGAAPWTSQETGGVPGQAEHGMVHSASRQMKGCTPDNAPLMYGAVNTAQKARFRVNRGTAKVLADYDNAKARAWLVAHLMSQGATQEDAENTARELARL